MRSYLPSSPANRDGFTLLELLLVVIVIGIVAAFIVTKISGAKEKAYIDAMKNDLRNFALAHEEYVHDNPGDLGEMDAMLAYGFAFSDDVREDSLQVDTDGFYLRVAHAKTDVKCRLDFGLEQTAENRIDCPGTDGAAPSGGGDAPVAEWCAYYPGGVCGTEWTGSPEGASYAMEIEVVEASQQQTVPEFSNVNRTKFAVGQPIVFDASASYDPDGAIISYQWDLDGDGTTDVAGVTVERAFLTTGIHRVVLTVVDDSGNDGEKEDNLQALSNDNTPVADFTWLPSSPLAGEAVTFDPSATTDADLPSDSLAFFWDFGSGQTSTDSLASQVFAIGGDYDVTLTVLDAVGHEASVTKTVTVDGDILLVSHWDPCASWMSNTLRDVVGSSDATLVVDNVFGGDTWEGDLWLTDYTDPNKWTASTPAPVVLRDMAQTWAGPGDLSSNTATSWTLVMLYEWSIWEQLYARLLRSDNDNGTGNRLDIRINGHRNTATTKHLYFDGPGGMDGSAGASWVSTNITDGAVRVYAMKVTDNGDGTSTLQLFEDGTEKLNTAATGTFTLSGDVHFWGTWDSNYTLNGSGGSVLYFEGDVPESFISARSADMLLDECTPAEMNAMPVADFTWPADPFAESAITFDASASSDGDGTVESYIWEWGDGEANDTTTSATFDHTFADAGDYDVTLTVVDDLGKESAPVTKTVTLSTPPVMMAFWDPCASWESNTLVDTIGGNNVSLLNANDAGWDYSSAIYWDKGGSGVPPSIELVANSTYAQGTSSFTATTWGLVMTLYVPASVDDTNLFFSASNTVNTDAGTASLGTRTATWYDDVHWMRKNQDAAAQYLGSQAARSAWVTYGWLMEDDGAGGSDITLYIDGVPQTGSKRHYDDNLFSLDGTLQIWGFPWSSGAWNLGGRAGAIAYMEGDLRTSDMAQMHTDLMAHECDPAQVNSSPVIDSVTWAPDVPIAGSSAAFEVFAHDGDGDPLTFVWDFGGEGSGTGETPSHAFSSGSSSTNYTVEVIASDGLAADTASVSVPVAASPAIIADWDPCESVLSTILTDTYGNINGRLVGLLGSAPEYYWNNETPTSFTEGTFDGSMDQVSYIDLGTPGRTSTDWGWMATINPTDAGTNHTILSVQRGDGTASSLVLKYTGALEWVGEKGCGAGCSSSHAYTFSGGSITWDAWQTVGVTVQDNRDGSTTVTGFIDGSSVGSATYTPFGPGTAWVGAVDYRDNENLSATWNGWPYLRMAGARYWEGRVTAAEMTEAHMDYIGLKCPWPIPPTADFTISPNPADIGATVTLDGSSSAAADGYTLARYEWTITGGTPSTATGVTTTVTFPTGGNHNVLLTVFDDGNQSAGRRKTVQVMGDPVASFTVTPYGGAVGETLTFDGSGSYSETSTITDYAWDFDNDGVDDESGSSATTTHSYGSDGSFTAKLTVTDDNGNTATATRTIPVGTVPTGPSAFFTPYPVPSDLGEAVAFDASGSTDSDGTIVSYVWDWGDGSAPDTLTGTSTTHAYASAGPADVTLTVEDNDGLTDTYSRTIAVSENQAVCSGTAPVAVLDLIYDDSDGNGMISTGTSVRGDATGSMDSDGYITAYIWEWTEYPTESGSNLTTTTNSYATTGEKEVVLTVMDDGGCLDADTATVTIGGNLPPVAVLTGQCWASDAAYLCPDSYRREYLFPENTFGTNDRPSYGGKYRSYDPDGVLRYGSYKFRYPKFFRAADGSWDYEVIEINQSGVSYYNIPVPGEYTMTLIVTDEAGAADTASATFTIIDKDAGAPPQAALSWSPATPSVGEEVRFSATATDQDSGMTSTYWDFGDGTAPGWGAFDLAPTHTYTSSGTFSITFKVSDDTGLVTTVTKTIPVGTQGTDQAPIPVFTTSPENGVTNETITFDATESYDMDGSIISYEWTVAPGVTRSGATISYIYSETGNYDVTLTVTDNAGLRSSTQKTINVPYVGGPSNISPEAIFDWSPLVADVGDTITFDGRASYDPDGTIQAGGYRWNFGDGSDPNQTQNTCGYYPRDRCEYVYSAPGTYSVSLRVWDHENASTTTEKSITILPGGSTNNAPTASFTYSPSSPSVGTAVSFEGTGSSDSDGSLTSYQWAFGDNFTGTGSTAVHSYSQPGIYTARLTVRDDDGASGTITRTFEVVGPQAPVARFTVSPNPVLAGSSVSFDASNSYDSDGTVTNYYWDFGDFGTGSGVATAHTYSTPGTYIAQLTITDSDGLSSTKDVAISVMAPVASITITPSSPTVKVPSGVSAYVNFNAILQDASGNPITNRGVEWSWPDGVPTGDWTVTGPTSMKWTLRGPTPTRDVTLRATVSNQSGVTTTTTIRLRLW